MREFHYRIPWLAANSRPGHHPSAAVGGGFEFRGHVPLLAAPDPRRLDIRASLRDPRGDWQVRSYRQRSAVPVVLVADLSASMGFAGRRRKLDVLADLAESCAYSAYRTGDLFGFVGCDDGVREVLPPAFARGAGAALAARLRELALGRGAAGLKSAARLLRRRSLVLLASDFHFPLGQVAEILASFAGHALVPLVLWDDAESAPSGFGLATVRDAETGAERTLLLRPALAERLRGEFERRRAAIADLCLAHGTRPLFLDGAFDADALTEYFFGAG